MPYPWSNLINLALGHISSPANVIISFVNPIFILIMRALILNRHISGAEKRGL